MAIGLNVKYLIKDSEGVRMLGSTNKMRRALLDSSLAISSDKVSKNFIF